LLNPIISPGQNFINFVRIVNALPEGRNIPECCTVNRFTVQ